MKFKLLFMTVLTGLIGPGKTAKSMNQEDNQEFHRHSSREQRREKKTIKDPKLAVSVSLYLCLFAWCIHHVVCPVLAKGQ